MSAAKAAERARIMALTPIERVEAALRAGRRIRFFLAAKPASRDDG